MNKAERKEMGVLLKPEGNAEGKSKKRDEICKQEFPVIRMSLQLFITF